MAIAAVRMLAMAGAMLMLPGGVLTSAAQPSYPSRSVRIVVSFPAGSATDIVARLLADRLTQKWNVPVVVENVPGAAGQIGTGRVVRAAPDGYTLIVSPPAQLVTHAALYKSLTYDPAQLVPVALLAQVPYGLTVRKSPELATIKQFIAFAKANPGKLTYASQGVGSTSHLTTKLFEKLAGVQMLHVPYRGSAPALTDIVAGNIDAMFDNIGNSLPLFIDNRVQIIAVADNARVRSLPNVPTLHETGFPGFRSITWFALAAPPKTPRELIGRVNTDVVEILGRRDVRLRLEELELSPAPMNPANTAAYIDQEHALWARVIKDANVQGGEP
jgi:tripartite-type tricarboxylate transporter receptor subunit TctC